MLKIKIIDNNTGKVDEIKKFNTEKELDRFIYWFSCNCDTDNYYWIIED